MKHVPIILAGIVVIVVLSITLFNGSDKKSGDAPPQPPAAGHIEKTLDPEMKAIEPEPEPGPGPAKDVVESAPASGTLNEPVPDVDSAPEDSFTPVEGGQDEDDDYDGEEDDYGC